jgi:hypothetical protein
MLKRSCRDALGGWGTAFGPHRSVQTETTRVPITCLTARKEFRFGLGGVSLGNEFNKHTDKEAEGTLEAAWEVGVRYFDVAPWYGFGLAERRFGDANNAILAAVGYNFRRLICWLRLLWRQILSALLAESLINPV